MGKMEKIKYKKVDILMRMKKCENLEQRRRIRRAIKAIMTRSPRGALEDSSELRASFKSAGPTRSTSFSSRKNIRRLSLKM